MAADQQLDRGARQSTSASADVRSSAHSTRTNDQWLLGQGLIRVTAGLFEQLARFMDDHPAYAARRHQVRLEVSAGAAPDEYLVTIRCVCDGHQSMLVNAFEGRTIVRAAHNQKMLVTLQHSVLVGDKVTGSSTTDRPPPMTCPQCEPKVTLLATKPRLVMEGVATPPQGESFVCPTCGTRIYLHPVSVDERRWDADCDAIGEDSSD
jgi:hypothetical protein